MEKMYEKINKRGWMAAILVILLFGAFIHAKYLNEFPLYIHAWAQSDWYSISLGYVDNGFDFFHPQTMLYNKQDDGVWGSPITSVDFPVHEYVVALLMQLFGTTSPWVFRIWTCFVGMVGMFFLYKLTFLLTDDWIKSTGVVGIAMTAPSYAYYFSGFIPSIPSLTFVIIGLWGYFSYVRKGKTGYFHVGFACLTLAAMIRMPQVVPLVAVCCFEVLRMFRGESGWRDKVVTVGVSFACYIGFYLWNRYLQAEYGSMFLGRLLPARDMDDARYVYENVRERWMFHYFQRIQHWLVLAAVMAAAIAAVIRAVKGRHSSAKECISNTSRLSLWWFLGIYFLGAILYVVAMLRQFSNHDYYFLDSLFLPFILLLVLSLAQLPAAKRIRSGLVGALLLAILLIIMGKEAVQMQQLRREPFDPALRCYEHFLGSDKLLDQAGISRDAKVVALFAYPKSSCFIQMQRRGYIVLNTDEKIVRKVLAADYDVIVIENDVLRQEFEAHGYVLKRLQPITGNEGIIVCTLSETPTADDAETLIERAQGMR